jgi:uncharacterized protein (DUF488 family)
MNIIFTCGHSSRAFSEFLKKLKENQIDTLVDVRSRPMSRWCPQYNRKALSEALSEANITYLFKGDRLGGRGENRDYEGAIDELVEMVKAGKRVCVCCSEADFKKCHRHEMLEPSFIERGVTVEHILYDKKI